MPGKLFLIVGPSGAGKGTAIDELKKRHPEYVFPLSCTTRKMRKGEKEGEVYHFISKKKFKKDIDEGEFLEWAVVHEDNYYGTRKTEIMDNIKKGKIVIREVDIQGFESIRNKLSKDEMVSIFITTRSEKILIDRIHRRAPMGKKELEKRLKSAKIELAKAKDCDYQVVSEEGKIEKMMREIEGIIRIACSLYGV